MRKTAEESKKPPLEARVDSLWVADEPDVLGAVGAEGDEPAAAADDTAATPVDLQEKAKRWDAIAPLIEPLLEKFGNVDAIHAAADQHGSEIAQLRDSHEVAAIATKLQQEVAVGKLDPSAYDEKLRYEVLANRIYRNELNGALASAKEQFPEMDEELVRHLARHPRAVHALAAHTHHRSRKIASDAEQRAVANYIASKANAGAAPESAKGASPVTSGASYKPKGTFGRWLGGHGM